MINNSQTTETVQEYGQDQDCAFDEDLPLFHHLRSSLNLPALPPIASQILKMCKDDDADVDQLAKLVSQDPAIVARLMQTANSSFYGGSRHKVTNILQAVTLLGMTAVGSLAFSFCFYRLFRDLNDPGQVGMDHVKYWRRSIMASIAGRTIGEWCKVPDPELVFVS
ncbi:MAG: HDOD domain-containing protein, partial [Nitrospirales bacterium]